MDDIRSLIVLMPPPEEQRRLVQFLDSVGNKTYCLIAKVREAIDRLKEYRTALISAAVTGKIDVRTHGHSGRSRNPGKHRTGPRFSPG